MTIAPDPAGSRPADHAVDLASAASLAAARRRRNVGRRESWRARHPAWPITALLAGYPVWWALGIADYMFIVLAIPMAARMYGWRARRERRVRLPPGFGLWLLFLLVMLAGVATLSLTAPETVSTPLSHRLLSFTNRAADYGAVTVMLLFAGNLTEQELSRRRLAWLLGLLAVYTAAGGLGGVFFPHFQLTSPLVFVIPSSLADNTLVQSWQHPGLAQVQGVLGVMKGRPKAPFNYTNTWGECLSILLPWLLVAWWDRDSRRQRVVVVAVLAAALVPLVYSLNRGVWVGAVLSLLYVAVRLAARGRLGLLAAVCGGLALTAVVVVATPLHTLVSERLQHGNSNAVRSSLSSIAVRDAVASPVIGYGDTRHEQGSPQSITVGPTAGCVLCGQLGVGTNGQLWLLFVADGFVGAAFYLGFFAFGIWRYRRDTTPYGLAGVLVLLLSFVYMFTYVAVVAPLAFTMLAYALLWRNDQHLRSTQRRPPGLRGAAGQAGAGRQLAAGRQTTARALT